jgi:single-strand DNA-binding protein
LTENKLHRTISVLFNKGRESDPKGDNMSGINKVLIVGRLGQDPELKTLPNGQAVCNISVATSEAWKDKDGNKQERTEWHRVVVWGKQAENVCKWQKKGGQIGVEGKLQTRTWEDPKGGGKRYATDIVASQVTFLSSGQAKTGSTGADAGAVGGGYDEFAPPPFDSNEEIPF